MRKIISVILSVLLLLSLFCTVNFAADGSMCKVDGYNIIARSTGVYLFDSYFGESTMTKGDILELVIEDGIVSAISENNSSIPRYGYVISVRGEANISKFSKIEVGDVCIVDPDALEVIFPDGSYSPFFETSIKFDNYNSTRIANSIIIYNKGETTKTNIWGNEAVVDANGFVSSFGGNDNAIPEGGYVISAVGAGRISELSDAVSIGLKATIDDETKTVTFSYNEESVIASMKIKLSDAKKSYSKAISEFEIIDKNGADEYISKLEGLLSGAEDALSSGNTAKAVAFSKAFDRYYADKYLFLNESPAVEGRAMWLRPSKMKNKNDVKKMVSEIKECGFNMICLELFFDSTFICPLPEDGYIIQNPSFGGFDVLQAFIDECNELGVELHGWLPVLRVSYSTSTYYDDSLASKKPEWLCVSKNGNDYVSNEYGDGYFIDPSNKEATDYLLSVYEYILTNYKLDGLQLDYIRYPNQTGEDFGYNEGTVEKFISEYGVSPFELSKSDMLWEKWVDFRCAFVTDFVGKIVSLAKEISPRVAVSCDVAPDISNTNKTHLQDSKKWMEDGIIEIAFPMAYGSNVVDMYAAETVEAFGGKGFSYIGLGDYGYETFIDQILSVRSIGADGFAFFAYSQYSDGNYKNYIAKTILSTPAVSPTYNSHTAVNAQLEVISSRLELIGGYDGYQSEIAGIISKLENEKLSAVSAEIIEFIASFRMPQNEQAKKKLEADFGLLERIITLSHDEYRNFSNDEMTGDNSGAESVSVSGDGSEVDVNEGESNSFIVFGVIVAVIAVVVVCAFIFLKNAKKGHGMK